MEKLYAKPKFYELKQAIKEAIIGAIKELNLRGEQLYYVALCTSGEALPPYLCASSHEAFEHRAQSEGWSEQERMDYKYSSVYSPYFDFASEQFAAVRGLFEARGDYYGSDTEYEREVDFRMEAMTQAMQECDRMVLFSDSAERRDVVITVEVVPPDSSNTKRALSLNPPEALGLWLELAAEPE